MKQLKCGKKKYLILLILLLIGFLILITYFGASLSSSSEMASCIFCDISNGKNPQTKIEVETSEFIIFKDIKPASTYHYLAVPKRHLTSLEVLTKDDDKLLVQMKDGLEKFFSSKGISTDNALFGFHMPPFLTVKHLHLHAIAPKEDMPFYYRWIFKPNTPWFLTVENAREYIKKKEL